MRGRPAWDQLIVHESHSRALSRRSMSYLLNFSTDYSGASSGDEPTIVCPEAKFIRPPLDTCSMIEPLHHDPASGVIIRVVAMK